MIKYIVFIIFSITTILLISCSGSITEKSHSNKTDTLFLYNNFDDLFKMIDFDTLQVYPGIENDLDIILKSNDQISNYLNYEIDSGFYYPLFKIQMDQKDELTGYLILFKGILNNSEIKLYIYSNSENDFIFTQVVSSHILLESAYEETRNSWITDIDKDGILDIAMYYELIDFELPNEFMGNASRSEKYIYQFDGEKYNYQYWQEGALKEIKIKR
jgi:hypothetical protein